MTRSVPQVRLVNDVHSRLNATVVRDIVAVQLPEDVQATIARARREGLALAVCGGRHAMGGQQFLSDGLLIDTAGLQRVLAFDAARGLISVEAGIQWPALFQQLHELQAGTDGGWGVAQKQTGADRFSLGGSLSANVHGRGLAMKPIVADVESITLMGADAQPRRCSRSENAELFALAIGGYGMFGVITEVTLRLARRRKLRRLVELGSTDDLMAAFERRIAEGCLYGDFQFAIDPQRPDYLNRGVFACYQPVADDTPIPAGQLALGESDWVGLLELAHRDKSEAFRRYAGFYLATAGQVYWSDLHQLSYYLDDYHAALDESLGHCGSEVICELYVPRSRFAGFMRQAAQLLREREADVVYGTVRLIRRDDESFLPWAREDFACVIFNLHTPHDPGTCAQVAETFECLNALAMAQGGSFYLTYHRHATAKQLRTCHPRIDEWLAAKLAFDPEERFQSDWYRHLKAVLDGDAA
ncbi:FAD-binding oxidoreductase [Ideonella sp. YS5]|uniref:FAD-binding oxidoreductase n=1 Tax=Ideonella sp. YS5 TaxID=3453714 RepID=UPI003EF03396